MAGPQGYRGSDADRLRSIMESQSGERLPYLNDPELTNNLGETNSRATGFQPLVGENDEDFLQYNSENLDSVVSGNDAKPVPLTDIPTSSTNSSMPRTVAAGWAEYSTPDYLAYIKSGGERKGKMTVMFRDGTLYNYYEVTQGEWENFSASISKGAPWLNKGFVKGKQTVDGLFLSKPRGLADTTGISDKTWSTIWRVSRTAQVRYRNTRETSVFMGGKRFEQFKDSVPKSAKKKAGLGAHSYTGNPQKVNSHKVTANKPNTSASKPKSR
jgi:hypothetical protein